VLNSADAPTDVINRMLDLVEFMEQKLMALPISHTVLGEVAFQNHAYAKALHHKEIDAFQETSAQEIEALISINSNLQQHDAAWGTLLMAQSEYDISEHEAWYERLGRWQEALVAYNKRQSEDPSCLDSFYGRMRCLHALGEWKQLSQDIDEHWVRAGLDGKRELAPMAAAAAWSLSEWDAMDDYISAMRADSPDRAFYKAILAIHKVQYPRALAQITRARDLLENETTFLNGDNYARSYTLSRTILQISFADHSFIV
jgi:FKBP12-rapamycin complex-associated protein